MIAKKFELGEVKQIIASSGGNAGLATAYASNLLGKKFHINIFKNNSLTAQLMKREH